MKLRVPFYIRRWKHKRENAVFLYSCITFISFTLIALSFISLLQHFYLRPVPHLCHRFYCVVRSFMFENNADETRSVRSKSLYNRLNILRIKNKQIKCNPKRFSTLQCYSLHTHRADHALRKVLICVGTENGNACFDIHIVLIICFRNGKRNYFDDCHLAVVLSLNIQSGSTST